ncbi:MAG: hypothetical protein ACFB2Z_05455 [Maricaulaceae bacterium]
MSSALITAPPPAPAADPTTALTQAAATWTARWLAPYLGAMRFRNIALDEVFYDVGGLSLAEHDWLLGQTTDEGVILVVHPAGRREMGIAKHADIADLRATPGAMLRRFSIAGVGSSDLGAAAFARTLANRYQEPVGAIVAGYGLSDIAAEAMGGWFALGAANRWIAVANRLDRTIDRLMGAPVSADTWRLGPERCDADTLRALFRDPDREIRSIAGHSKGALAIASAFQSVSASGDRAMIARARAARVVTFGAVVALPPEFDQLAQYLGALDGFGAANSQIGAKATLVPGAGHHLNPRWPGALNAARILAREPR